MAAYVIGPSPQVVKRWDDVTSNGRPFVMYDDGTYAFDGDSIWGRPMASQYWNGPQSRLAIAGTLPPTWELGKTGASAAITDPNAIVRRWEKMLPHAPKYTFVQYANLECEWAPGDGGKHFSGRNPVDYWARESGDRAQVIFTTRLRATWAAPGWEGCAFDPAPNAASSIAVDRCKYNLLPIDGISEEWRPYVLKKFNGAQQTVQRYSAPIAEQQVAATDRVIRTALRNLREVPLCNVTGMPVSVIAKPANLTMQAYFKCEHCK